MDICEVSGKLIHRNYQEAAAHIAKIAKRREVGRKKGVTLTIYRCKAGCGYWHIAHTNKKPTTKLEEHDDDYQLGREVQRDV